MTKYASYHGRNRLDGVATALRDGAREETDIIIDLYQIYVFRMSPPHHTDKQKYEERDVRPIHLKHVRPAYEHSVQVFFYFIS